MVFVRQIGYFNGSFMSTTLREEAYQLIRRRIIGGQLTPGSRVSELALSKEMGISRGPVHDAILELARERLVEQVQRVGMFVKRPSRKNIKDLFQIREWLEGEAAAEAAGRIHPEQLEDLQRSCDETRVVAEKLYDGKKTREQNPEPFKARIEIADATFHLTLISACDNKQLTDIMANKHILSRMWYGAPGEPIVPSPSQVAWVYRDHSRTLRAVRKGDADMARESMRLHIRKGCQRMLDSYDRQQRQLAMGQHVEQLPSPLLSEIRKMEEEGVQREKAPPQAEPLGDSHIRFDSKQYS